MFQIGMNLDCPKGVTFVEFLEEEIGKIVKIFLKTYFENL